MSDIPETMTPQEAVKALEDMTPPSNDRRCDNEAVHGDADKILLAALRGAGQDLAAVADAWTRCKQNVGFWYA